MSPSMRFSISVFDFCRDDSSARNLALHFAECALFAAAVARMLFDVTDVYISLTISSDDFFTWPVVDQTARPSLC